MRLALVDLQDRSGSLVLAIGQKSVTLFDLASKTASIKPLNQIKFEPNVMYYISRLFANKIPHLIEAVSVLKPFRGDSQFEEWLKSSKYQALPQIGTTVLSPFSTYPHFRNSFVFMSPLILFF